MRKYSHLWLIALAFTTNAIGANKQFVIRLKGNILYRESAKEKPMNEPKSLLLNQSNQEPTGVSLTKKNETVLEGGDQAVTDTIGISGKNNAVQMPDRSGYIVLQSHCLDQDSLNPLDSVVMDVYSNGEHITAGISDKSGFITTDSIPPGNYSVIIYRNNYNPASIFFSRTSLNSKLYMDIPLKRKEKYLYDSVGQRILSHILSFEIIPILLVILLIISSFRQVRRYAI
jgi:hypothetical protein